MKDNQGFTLMEVVAVIFVFGVLLVGISALVSTIIINSRKQESLLYGADQARRISFQIEHEIRNATTSNTGSYPVALAEAQQLILYANIDSDVGIERVRYYLDNGILRRGVVEPSGAPLTYVLASEVVTEIQRNVANGAVPLFYYYDESYDGTADNFLAAPVSVTDVRYIKMNLRIVNTGGNNNTGYYVVTAGGTVRNLKENN